MKDKFVLTVDRPLKPKQGRNRGRSFVPLAASPRPFPRFADAAAGPESFRHPFLPVADPRPDILIAAAISASSPCLRFFAVSAAKTTHARFGLWRFGRPANSRPRRRCPAASSRFEILPQSEAACRRGRRWSCDRRLPLRQSSAGALLHQVRLRNQASTTPILLAVAPVIHPALPRLLLDTITSATVSTSPGRFTLHLLRRPRRSLSRRPRTASAPSPRHSLPVAHATACSIAAPQPASHRPRRSLLRHRAAACPSPAPQPDPSPAPQPAPSPAPQPAHRQTPRQSRLTLQIKHRRPFAGLARTRRSRHPAQFHDDSRPSCRKRRRRFRPIWRRQRAMARDRAVRARDWVVQDRVRVARVRERVAMEFPTPMGLEPEQPTPPTALAQPLLLQILRHPPQTTRWQRTPNTPRCSIPIRPVPMSFLFWTIPRACDSTANCRRPARVAAQPPGDEAGTEVLCHVLPFGRL